MEQQKTLQQKYDELKQKYDQLKETDDRLFDDWIECLQQKYELTDLLFKYIRKELDKKQKRTTVN